VTCQSLTAYRPYTIQPLAVHCPLLVSWPAHAVRNVDSRRATRRGSVLATDKLTSRASRLIGHALECFGMLLAAIWAHVGAAGPIWVPRRDRGAERDHVWLDAPFLHLAQELQRLAPPAAIAARQRTAGCKFLVKSTSSFKLLWLGVTIPRIAQNESAIHLRWAYGGISLFNNKLRTCIIVMVHIRKCFGLAN
jgi:hypothetical protein